MRDELGVKQFGCSFQTGGIPVDIALKRMRHGDGLVDRSEVAAIALECEVDITEIRLHNE